MTRDQLKKLETYLGEAADSDLNEAARSEVKLAARSLLQRLRDGQPVVLVQDWHRDSQTHESVRAAMTKVLDSHLPQSYGRDEFAGVRDRVFSLMLDRASQAHRWAA